MTLRFNVEKINGVTHLYLGSDHVVLKCSDAYGRIEASPIDALRSWYVEGRIQDGPKISARRGREILEPLWFRCEPVSIKFMLSLGDNKWPVKGQVFVREFSWMVGREEEVSFYLIGTGKLVRTNESLRNSI